MTGLLLNLRGIYNKPLGVAPVFSPLDLFSSGEEGAWYDPSGTSTVWATTTATIQTVAASAGVTATAGNLVARIDDKSGNGNHATQATVAARPVLRQSGSLYYLEFDGVDDFIKTADGSLNTGTVSVAVGVRSLLNNTVVWGLPQSPSSHTDPFFRFMLFRASPSLINVRLNGTTQALTDTFPSSTDLVFYQSSADPDIRKNGVDQSDTITPATITYPNTVPFLIGANAAGAENLSGRIYGLIALDRALTDTEIADTESYIADRTGVTL